VTPWADGDSAPPELLEKIRSRRVNRELIALDRVLLKSIPLAEGWNEYLKRIRTDLALPIQFRELIICRVAQLNGADYEWQQHAPVYLREGGTQKQLDDLHHWQRSSLFDVTEKSILALTDESTKNIKVADKTFDDVKSRLGEVQAVEAVAVIATYNMVSRLLIALQVGH
jgi:alkylhydroperoxidase family enzyme